MKYIVSLIAALAIGCAVTSFDQVSVNTAVGLKTEMVTVMEGIAVAPDHPPILDATVLLSKLDAQLAYEKGKDKAHSNFETVEQWRVVSDHKGISLGRFLQDTIDGKLQSPANTRNLERIFGKTLDAIIEGEGAKLK